MQPDNGLSYTGFGLILPKDVTPPVVRFAPHDPANPVDLPKIHTKGAAAFDLAASEDVTIPAGQTVVVKTGVRAQIPDGHVGLIRDRSSLHKKGLFSLAGVIDSDYRGEIGMVLHCIHRDKPCQIARGERLAQMVIVPCLTDHEHVEDLEPTERGDKGFGSTG